MKIKHEDGTEKPGSKVVQGGPVDFDQGADTKPDSLDGKVAQATPSNTNLALDKIYYDNMQFLAEKLREANIGFGEAQPIVPYIMHAVVSSSLEFIQITPKSCDCKIFKSFLREHFGNDIENTGLLNKIPIVGIDYEKVCKLIPEFSGLKPISVENRANPYLHALNVNLEIRPFIAGVMKHYSDVIDLKTNEKFYTPSIATCYAILKPVTLKHMIAYAKTIGVLDKVGEISEMYLK